jgi:hypothetical protein
MKTGDIFAIDRRIWARVCDLGVNAAIGFLVIARGTGGDNRTTSWSVNAIEKYTSISRPRAVVAVKALIADKLLTVLKEGKRPQYRIASPDEVPSIKLSAKERAEFKPELIWFPNSIVDGLADETPPIEILRQSQNIHAVRMFGNFYFTQDLANDSGCEWRKNRGIYRTFERVELGSRGEYVVWGFPKSSLSAGYYSFIATEHRNHTDEKGDKAKWDSFWVALRVLTDSGLLQIVHHLVDGDDSDSEIVHPLPLSSGDGEDIEKKISVAANLASSVMIPPQIDISNYWAVVPVRRHMANVQLVGIARLRYRPQTAATAAWLAKAAECEKWALAYRKLAEHHSGENRQVA